MLRQQSQIISNILILTDMLITLIAGYVAYSTGLILLNRQFLMPWNDFFLSLLFVMLMNNYFMGRFGFYSGKHFHSCLIMARTLITSLICVFAILSTAIFIIKINAYPRIFFLLYFFVLFVFLFFTRILLNIYLYRRSSRAFNSRQILVVGTPERIRCVVDALEKQQSWGHKIAGCLIPDGIQKDENIKIPVLGSINNFEQMLLKNNLDEVILALPSDYPLDLQKMLSYCDEIGVSYRVVPGLFDVNRSKIKVENIHGLPTLVACSVNISAASLMYKKILDIIVGFIGIVIFIFLYPIVGLAIKIESKGPILFKQKRVGMNNRIFNLYKFRTMVNDAESLKPKLLKKSEMNGPIFKIRNDPRITRVGKFLRNTSIDEFPQFINVLKGEISVVGTRPPLPDEVRKYENWHRKRMSLKPGITGLWQVSGRNKVNDFDKIVKLDIKYINRWRFSMDLIILLKTIWVVLTKNGAS